VQAAIAAGIARVRGEADGALDPRHEAILAGLRAKIGLDQVEWMVVGAAPMSRDVQEFLLGIGLPITEIYGMSEASCCVTMAHPSEAKIGSVGPAVDGLQMRLDEDGELLLKGPTITRGYRGRPDQTAEAIDAGGWLHTGDICTLDDDGFLRIVDRKKELIINAAGKNMSPANIEGVVKSAHPLIGQVAVIGDRRPYNVALIVLDPEFGADANDPAVRDQVAAAVEQANAKLARVEQIKRFALLADEWLPGGDELTPTMKLKRRPIAEKYAEVVEDLYRN
jgi:long-subunit acyl-CoA synthetase (AMP-forming)